MIFLICRKSFIESISTAEKYSPLLTVKGRPYEFRAFLPYEFRACLVHGNQFLKNTLFASPWSGEVTLVRTVS